MKEHVYIALLIMLLLFSIYSYAQLSEERKRIDELSSRIENAEVEINMLRENLARSDRNIEALEKRIEELERTFNETIIEQKYEIEHLRNELESIEVDMNYYFEWFKTNSDLNISSDLVRDLRDAIDPCISSVASLACIGFMNNDYFHLAYLNDTETGRRDFIQNITCTLQRGGGDCEDFAVLFMAELNYAKRKARYFEAWKPGEGIYRIYGDWYLRNAEPVLLEGRNVYVVCYSGTTTGHCLNAICEKDAMSILKSTRDIERALSTCVFVEPQEYGIIKEISREGNTTYIGEDPLLEWLLIMGSSDLCLLSRSNSTWKCFSDVSGEIERILNSTWQ